MDGDDADVDRLRTAIRQHPCHACPDREDHARWAERYLKLDRDVSAMRRRIDSRTNSIARQFDRVCEVLETLGYLTGDRVTGDGLRLTRLYNELDLVAAECLRQGVWDRLTPQQLAACLTGLVYESRSADDAPLPRLPSGAVGEVADRMSDIWADLVQVERTHKVSFLRRLDFGFAWPAHEWAGGASLDVVLGEADIAAGDFVRAVKQLLDVIDQVADAAGDTPVRATARAAADALRHGVIAYSSVSA